MIPFGRGKFGPSSPNLVCPIRDRTCPGLISTGVQLGGGIISPVGSSEAAWSYLCCFLECLLSVYSTLAESDLDPNSRQLCGAGDALRFPRDLNSLLRLSSSDLSLEFFAPTLQQRSLSEDSFSSRALRLFVDSSYQSRYQESLPLALSTASSSMQATTFGHPVQSATLIRWDGSSTVGLFAAAITCVAYVPQVEHFPLWVIITSSGIPWIVKVCSCSLSSNNFEASSNWDNCWSSVMSMSGHCGNRSVMWSHLIEVVCIKPWWCLLKHLCSYIFALFL